jgi:hypothetical protein
MGTRRVWLLTCDEPGRQSNPLPLFSFHHHPEEGINNDRGHCQAENIKKEKYVGSGAHLPGRGRPCSLHLRGVGLAGWVREPREPASSHSGGSCRLDGNGWRTAGTNEKGVSSQIFKKFPNKMLSI